MEMTEKKLWQRLAKIKRPSLRITVRNELVELYLWLANDVADYFAKRVPSYIRKEDLAAEACIGLMQAVESYRLSGGASPATFMRFRITGRVRDWLRAHDHMSRLNRQRLVRAEAADQAAGRTLTPEECRDQLGFTRPMEATVRSIHKTITGPFQGHEATLADLLPADSNGSGDLRDCSYLLKGLTQRSRLIVLMYYCEGVTMKEIGKELAMSESRISQLMPSILEQIRHNALAAGLADRRAVA